ncbi:Formate dehydrogenase H [Raoultella terrigena]|uniref:Formate dehydrogenase H n=1 Tax=Raoultella terrigena TaxID=577 RepID=A0A3P8M223_RAOTE|nr:Formate dehydrogenase H [Raoultella terrigena]
MPELSAVRKASEELELVIVQDIFMTKTAAAADVILPSTSWGEHEGVYTAADRGFQRFFKAVEPKWDLKTDWQIISEIATRMGYPMRYSNTQEIWDELRICVRTFTAPPTRRWASWAISCGRAATNPPPTRGPLICLKRNSLPQRTGAVLHLRLGCADRQAHRGVSDGALNGARSRPLLVSLDDR